MSAVDGEVGTAAGTSTGARPYALRDGARPQEILEGLAALSSALAREAPDVAELARAANSADEMNFEDVMTAVDQAGFVFERTNQLRAALVRAFRARTAAHS